MGELLVFSHGLAVCNGTVMPAFLNYYRYFVQNSLKNTDINHGTTEDKLQVLKVE